MQTFATVTIVHLGFCQPGEIPATQVIRFEAPSKAADPKAVAAEAFHVTNCPVEYGAHYSVVQRSGPCYTLSVGDLVIVDRTVLKCTSNGWDILSIPSR